MDLDQFKEVNDALGHAVHYEYSAYERITAIIDPAGNESRYDYDLKNRLVRVRRHGRVREEYEYDAGDHFVRKRDGDGNILPGESGAEFWYVVPDATDWSTGTMLIQDGNQVDVAAFIPAPEPGTLALVGGALLALGALHRRRKGRLAA